MYPRAHYDRDSRTLTIELASDEVVGTVAFPDDDHLLDLNAAGAIVGIEILTPNDLKLVEIAERYDLNLHDVLLAALRALWLDAPTGVSLYTSIEHVEATLTTTGISMSLPSATMGSRNAGPVKEIQLIDG